MNTGRRQRGVALLTAVLLVALATILAMDLAWQNVLNVRRSTTLSEVNKARMYALGGEAWAAITLRQDAQDSTTDHLAENWATPLPPLPLQRESEDGAPIDEGTLEGLLEDMQGRFNVNNLIQSDGEVDEVALAQFERLLSALQLEPRWAQLLVDWLDADVDPMFPDGAEDAVYSGQTPPYRTGNTPITSTSELMVLTGMDRETFDILRNHVTALPVGTPVNVCTATCDVLNALTEEVPNLCGDAETLIEDRSDDCYPNLEDLQQTLSAEEFELLRDYVSESSSYFRATGRVTIGTSQITLYSLLERDQTGNVRPVLRSFGAD